MITAEATLLGRSGYALRAQLSTAFANLTSAKLSFDLDDSTNLNHGDVGLKVEWNEENSMEAKILYEVNAQEVQTEIYIFSQ